MTTLSARDFVDGDGDSAVFVKLLHRSRDAVVIREPGGRVVFWNQGAETLYGYSAAEMVGGNSHDRLNTSSVAGVAAIDDAHRRDGWWEGELTQMTKGGRTLVVESRQVVVAERGAELILEINRDITRRKLTEAALRDSEARFSRAFNAAPVSLTITSLATGRLLEVNETFEQITGFTRAEAIGRTTVELGLWADEAQRDAELAMVADTGQLRALEYRFRAKNGTEIVGLLSAERLDIGGEPCALTVIENITDRVRAEAELQEVQHQVLALAKASALILASPQLDAVMSATIDVARDVFSADGYALWQYRDVGGWRVVRSFGISKRFADRYIEVHSGRPAPTQVEFSEPLAIADIATAPLVADLREAHAAEGIESMIVFPLTIRGERSATLVFYFHQRRQFKSGVIQAGSALANVAAAALTTASFYEEQRAAREAADYARQQAAFLADAGTVLSGSLEHESTLAAVARLAVPAIADWCAVDILGERGAIQRLAVAHVDPAKVQYAHELQKRYPADPDTPGGLHEVLRSGRPAMMSRIPPDLLDAAARDEEHRRIIAELGLTSYMCVPMLAHGKAFGAITFVSAESGREYSEEDLRMARELAARASLAVENARSYARAAEANRLKDEFLATLSHEMRTPLNAVLGYARMLRLGTIAPGRTGLALEVLERNATSLKQIIEDVLDVSRIVSGRLRLHLQTVDLGAILEESRATMLPAADAKGVRLETVIDREVRPLRGDPDRLQQVVWNLVSNAIKFTPRGGRVELRLSALDSHVEVTVTDTGEGITADFLPFVFDRFRQADATFAREHGGLGLGLAIAKHLVELHGGTIDAWSAGAGNGAVFTVRLPLRPGPHDETIGDAARAETTAPDTLRTHAPRRLDGIHVLAVDDEPDSVNLLRVMLEASGATVTTVGSGPAALDALRAGGIDVIVADIGMPGMDGLQFVRAVRQLEGPARNTPAAALTAYARSQDRVASAASGFHMHLAKPIDPDELVAAVAALASTHDTSAYTERRRLL